MFFYNVLNISSKYKNYNNNVFTLLRTNEEYREFFLSKNTLNNSTAVDYCNLMFHLFSNKLSKSFKGFFYLLI